MKITVLNLTEAKNYIPSKSAIIIRIFDSNQIPELKGSFLAEKHFFFSDLEDKDSPYSISQEEADSLIAFVKENSSVKEIVIHCVYAQGRSPAVGYVLSEYFNIPFSKEQYPDINHLVIERLQESLKKESL